MALSKIWVFAEAVDGKVAADHPRAADQGPRARRHGRGGLRRRRRRRRRRHARRARRHQGARHRRPRRHARRACPSPRPSPRRSSGGNAPDLHPVRHHLRRPRRRRPPVGASSTSRCSPTTSTSSVDGDAVVATEPIFGGTQLVKTKFTGRRPAPRARPAEVVRRRGVAAAAPPRSRPLAVDPAPPARPRSSTATSRSPPGPSSTRPPSSSPAAAASARPASTR